MTNVWEGMKKWESSYSYIIGKTGWLTNTWKDAQHHSLLEKCKSKPQEITNVGDVEKQEPSYTFGETVNWCSHYGKQYGNASKN